MDERQMNEQSQDGAAKRLKRRGILAGSGVGINGTGQITGVQGVIDATSTAAQQTFAVIGRNSLNRTDAYGVLGTSDHGVGVYGQTGAGLYGVRGDAGPAPGSAGLLGVATSPNGVAFGSVVGAPATIAGFFNGTVYVNGKLVVSDPSYKSGLLSHPDGSKRLVYCMESPESWIEDFGEGTLTNGKATIILDKEFAAVVHTAAYHVFPISHDPTSKGLAVAARHADRFEVQEHSGSDERDVQLSRGGEAEE